MTTELNEQIIKISELERKNLLLIKDIESASEQKHSIENKITKLMNDQELLKIEINGAWNKLKEMIVK